MRIYFIKDWDDRSGGGTYHKAGEDVTIWPDTGERALREGVAVPYELRHLKRFDDESQTTKKTDAQSKGKDKRGGGPAQKKNDNK